MIYLQIEDEIISKFPQIKTDHLISAAETVLKHQEMAYDTTLSLVFCDNETIQNLNLQYRDIDAPTDVLSFPLQEKDPETGNLYLGDVIISIEYALNNLDDHNTEIDKELTLLIVHGVLHLIGYDHADQEEKEQMWSLQTAILMQLGIQLNV